VSDKPSHKYHAKFTFYVIFTARQNGLLCRALYSYNRFRLSDRLWDVKYTLFRLYPDDKYTRGGACV